MKKDLRSPLARARDKWLNSAEGKCCLNTNILFSMNQARYLRNRIELAFVCGAIEGEKIQKLKGKHE